ncbi:hypothetical protein BG006_011405 [Podila minutissima]|uniref:RRM domain-containing protein n=1 Tax=Podila minutissima TaxID=64525 RepID=A0A9P5SPP2_9FUNG|nr:hypothetical protein BG006_011405 [Podila minutissima]
MTYHPELAVSSRPEVEPQTKRVSSSPTVSTLPSRTSSPETPTPALEQTMYPRSYSPRKTRGSHKARQDDSHPGLGSRSVSSDNALSESIARMSLDESHSATNGGSTSPHDNLARAIVQDSDTHPSQNSNGFSDDEALVGDVDDLSETHGISGGQPTDDADVLPRGEPQACLFVASLCSTRTESELVDSVTKHFSKWGPLLNVKVLKDWAGRPYSFVQFVHVPHAQRAMAEAQNSVVDGRHIRIEQARVHRTLYILRIARSTSQEEISDVLKEYGPLEEVSIYYDPGPPRSRRYAFARFAYREDAIRAYMCLRGASKWIIEWAPNVPNPHHFDHVDKESIFVGQLDPDTVTEEALYERFSKYGDIMNLNLIKKKKPSMTQFSAFAFIEYDSEQSSTNAIANENCSPFLGSIIRVQYREIPELRFQRQQNSQMAPRTLTMPPNAEGYFDGTGLFMPCRAQDPGHPLSYQLPYPPYSGLNVAMPGYVSRPPISGPPYRPGAPQRLPNSEMPQGYYSGATSFGAPPNGHDPRSRNDAHSSFEYIQTPEGIFYPHASFSSSGPYVCDQGQPGTPPTNPSDLPWRTRSVPRRRGFDSGREGFTGQCQGSDSSFGYGDNQSGGSVQHSNARGSGSSRNAWSSSDAHWSSR